MNERQLIASMGGLSCWARRPNPAERREAMAPAREGMRRKWEAKADPEGRMSPEDLAVAVDNLKRAHYRRMALRSAQARRGGAA